MRLGSLPANRTLWPPARGVAELVGPDTGVLQAEVAVPFIVNVHAGSGGANQGTGSHKFPSNSEACCEPPASILPGLAPAAHAVQNPGSEVVERQL